MGADETAGFRRHRLLANCFDTAVAAFAALFAAWPFLRTDRFVVGFDTQSYSAPNLVLDRSVLGPTQWNGYLFGGSPHLGNPNSGAWSPIGLLTHGLSPNRALNLVVGVHLLIAAAAMFVVARRSLRLSPPAGGVAAAAFVLSGPVMAKTVQYEQFLTLAWVPVAMASVAWCIRRPGPASIAAAGTSTALVLSVGHPQIAVICSPLIALWAVAHFITRPSFSGLAAAAAGALLGIGLAAPALLSAAANLQTSAFRGGQPGATGIAYAANPWALPQLLLGDVTSPDPAFVSRSFEGVSAIGAGLALLAIVGVLAGLAQPGLRLLVGMLTLVGSGSLLASWGPRTVVYDLILRVPLLNQGRVAARFVVPFAFCTALLGAMALDSLRRRGPIPSAALSPVASNPGHPALDHETNEEPKPRVALMAPRRWRTSFRAFVRGAGWPVVLGTALLFIALFLSAAVDLSGGRIDLPPTKAVLVWCGAIVVVAAALMLLVLFGAHRRNARAAALAVLTLVIVGELTALSQSSFGRLLSRPKPFETAASSLDLAIRAQPGRNIALTDDRLGDPEYLGSALRPNVNVNRGVRSIDGYDGGPAVSQRWGRVVAVLSGRPFDNQLTLRSQTGQPLQPGLWARYGVSTALVDISTPSRADLTPGWTLLTEQGTLRLMGNPVASGDAWLRFATIAAPGPDAAFAAVQNGLAQEVSVVEGSSRELSCESACSLQTVTVARHRDRRTMSVGLDRAGLLILGEQWWKGWTAEIDGHETPIVIADGFWNAVYVEPGNHTVVLTFRAPGAATGFAAAGLSSLLLLGLVALTVRARIRTARGRRRATTSKQSSQIH